MNSTYAKSLNQTIHKYSQDTGKKSGEEKAGWQYKEIRHQFLKMQKTF